MPIKCKHQYWRRHTAGMHPIRAAQSRQKRQRTAELRFCSDAFYLILYPIHHAPFTLAECRSGHWRSVKSGKKNIAKGIASNSCLHTPLPCFCICHNLTFVSCLLCTTPIQDQSSTNNPNVLCCWHAVWCNTSFSQPSNETGRKKKSNTQTKWYAPNKNNTKRHYRHTDYTTTWEDKKKEKNMGGCKRNKALVACILKSDTAWQSDRLLQSSKPDQHLTYTHIIRKAQDAINFCSKAREFWHIHWCWHDHHTRLCAAVACRREEKQIQ